MAAHRRAATPAPAAPDPVFALLYSIALLDMLASSLTFALTPGRVLAMGGDAKTIGLLSGFAGALQLVGGPILGRYSDRLADRRWALVLGLLASALGSVVAALATEPTMLLLSRVPAGLFAHTLNQLRAVRAPSPGFAGGTAPCCSLLAAPASLTLVSCSRPSSGVR